MTYSEFIKEVYGPKWDSSKSRAQKYEIQDDRGRTMAAAKTITTARNEAKMSLEHASPVHIVDKKTGKKVETFTGTVSHGRPVVDDHEIHESLDEATFKRVTRVRGGKVQRRKKVADKPGYKVKDGKVVRMKASERLKRKRGAKKSARKRKGKKSQIARATKRSMRKRKSKGL